MMSSRNLIIAAAVLLVLAAGAGGWFLFTKNQTTAQPAMPTPPAPRITTSTGITTPPASTSTATNTAVVSKNVVTITAAGFSPKEIKIKVGDTVIWVNEDNAMHNVSSVVHPTHQVYPPLNIGNIAQGEMKSLSFPAAGNFKYHDHLTPNLTGTVVVE